MTGCLSENTLLDLVEGRLDGAARQTATEHVAVCAACQDIAGDVARSIVDQGARELAAAAISVSHRLEFPAPPTVILSGGTLHGVARLRDRTTACLEEEIPGVTVRLLEAEPAHGAVRLARAFLSGRAAVPAYVDSLR